MDSNAYRDEEDMDHADSYWRRRVIALVAGLSLLGVLAWALTGGGKPPSPAAKASAGVGPAAAYSAAASSSNGAVSTASPGSVTGTSRAVGLPLPTGTSSSGAIGSKPTTPALRPAPAGATASGRTRPGAPCSPGAMVLSLFTSRPDYGGGQDPDFTVDAVSTASGACAFNTSPAKLYVVVMSSGRIIWDSADCARGPAGRVTDLRRGVPAQESVRWHRTISLPGCVTLASAARPGTYQVQARTATVASPSRTFKLER
jgi:hypothetical protein